MKGVSDACKTHQPHVHGGFINPTRKSRSDDSDALPLGDVQFDVAVTVESSASSRKGGGVAIKVIEAEVSGGTSKKVVGETRVKFSVPISAPSTDLLHM